jgi:hypothetical protein
MASGPARRIPVCSIGHGLFLADGSTERPYAGEHHSLRNLGDTEMQLLTVYDPRACATDHASSIAITTPLASIASQARRAAVSTWIRGGSGSPDSW